MAIDTWSVGCIFAELLAMQAESVRNPRDRRPLFPGRTCFPLSADNVLTVADQRDQLNVIFHVRAAMGEGGGGLGVARDQRN